MTYFDEIDEVATRRKLDEITTAGIRGLNESAARAAEIDKEFQESQARRQAEAEAMDKKVAEARAEAEAKAKETESTADDKTENPWPKEARRPRTLAFRGEDEEVEQPARRVEPKTEPVPTVAPPAAMPVAKPEPRPARRAVARADDVEDEDLSERSWMKRKR
ncbi:hypothetical protein EV193_106362 [Herbihabitans rhizosphaerae]|uniref:Uncharacterized protein n=1 Tax=Herbihabitans rhizosphaerae TaxID=1872711 RepID=A0A4Q7KLK0_9PSEU|nr:hypothetical protein [Herbihabitans rhizosphaerae]RZS37124.1 hypothetical protein EV193_106362 [Herbihabitans rhizosphaerae]